MTKSLRIYDVVRDGHLSDLRPVVGKQPNVKAYYWLTGNVELDGKTVQVGVTIREDNRGHLYYNHTNEEGPRPRTQVHRITSRELEQREAGLPTARV